MSLELTKIAESPQFLWNGVVCTQDGQLFASLPGWLGPTPGVVRIMPDGSLRPFPGNHWNEFATTKDPMRSFVDVNSIIIGENGSFWVIDAAAPLLGDAIEGAVKLVEIEIATGATKRVLLFGRQDAHSGTRLAHMRLHGHHAFLVESKEASIFVINLLDDSYRRILVGHPLLRCDPSDVPTIEGRRMELHGKPMYFHSDLIEFGADPNKILFMCLFGRKIFQVDVDVLKDDSLADAEVASEVSVAFKLDRSFVSGITRDVNGRLYLADGENGGISTLSPDGTVRSLVVGTDITWPIGPFAGQGPSLYFVDSQVNRIPVFTGGPDNAIRPWKMYKLETD